MPNLIKSIRSARRSISSTMGRESKIAYALLQINRLKSGFAPKVAYSESDIQRGVEQHLRAEGIDNPPDIDWGTAFTHPVTRLSMKNDWDEGTEEQILASTFSDILMGENIQTGAEWSKGNLGQMVRDWRAKGKEDNEIRKFVRRQVDQQARWHWTKMQRMVRDHGEAVLDLEGPDSGQGRDGKDLILDVLDMDPLSADQADHWMHVTERDTVVLDMINRIDRFIDRNADQNVKLLWKTMKHNPEIIGNRSELGRVSVTYVDEEDGQQKTAPLFEAMGKNRPSDLWYPEEKLVELVDQIKPQIKQELEAA